MLLLEPMCSLFEIESEIFDYVNNRNKLH